VFVGVCVFVRVPVYVHVCAWMRLCESVCMCVYVCVSVHVNVHVCARTRMYYVIYASVLFSYYLVTVTIIGKSRVNIFIWDHLII